MKAFDFRERSQLDRPVESVSVGATAIFREAREYVISVPKLDFAGNRQEFVAIGGEWLDEGTGIISFGNFVGQVQLFGAKIVVESEKLGTEGFQKMLEHVCEFGQSLIFSMNGRLNLEAASHSVNSEIFAFQQAQMLRAEMRPQLGSRGMRTWLQIIQNTATRHLTRERQLRRIEYARRVDGLTIQSIVRSPAPLLKVSRQAPDKVGPIAQALRMREDPPGTGRLPQRLSQNVVRTGFDTPENRFAKYALLSLQRLAVRFANHNKVSKSSRTEFEDIGGTLRRLLSRPHFSEVKINPSVRPSMALRRMPGYQDLLEFWIRLHCPVAFPPREKLQLFLEGRDVAKLYEYWVFVSVVSALQTIFELGESKPFIATIANEAGQSLSDGLRVELSEKLSVTYNKSFSRSKRSAYSTPLRPDVLISFGEKIIGLDAKYRLQRIDSWTEDDEDSDNNGGATYKRADLYKMHTYRDAILNLKSVFVAYPGTATVLFSKDFRECVESSELQSFEGVGAIALRPDSKFPSNALCKILEGLLLGHETAGEIQGK